MLGMRVLVGLLSYQRIRLSKLQKLGPALDHVKDELRQIGPIVHLVPQLMAQLREAVWQIHESAWQQHRFEFALLDLHSELQCLKSY